MKGIKGINIQCQQMLNLLALVVLAKQSDLFFLSWMNVVTILVVAICIEQAAIYWKHPPYYFSYSAIITAIGVMLMMASTHLWIYIVVVALGLGQKYILRIAGRHFFNPSNFALLMALLFFYEEAHIVLGQLGDEQWAMLFVVILALWILWRVGRWIVPCVFVLSYALLSYYFIIMADPVMTIEAMYYRFASVSFVVFIVFMLTDPRTTPNQVYSQAGFALCVASGAVILDSLQGFRVQHLFLSLAFCSPWVVLISLWETVEKRYYLVGFGSVLMASIVIAIIIIEGKAPYYFSMAG